MFKKRHLLISLAFGLALAGCTVQKPPTTLVSDASTGTTETKTETRTETKAPAAAPVVVAPTTVPVVVAPTSAPVVVAPTAAPATGPAAAPASQSGANRPQSDTTSPGDYDECPSPEEASRMVVAAQADGRTTGPAMRSIGHPTYKGGKRDGDDVCVFSFNKNDLDAKTFIRYTVLPGIWATNNERDNKVRVWRGEANLVAEGSAATLRFINHPKSGKPIYGNKHPFRDQCVLLGNEIDFTKQEAAEGGFRSEHAHGNISCPGLTTASSSPPTSAAPASAPVVAAAAPAAPATVPQTTVTTTTTASGKNPECVNVNDAWLKTNIGGNEKMTWMAGSNLGDWEYKGKGKGNVDFKYPGFGTLDSWQGSDVSKTDGTPKGTLVAKNDMGTWHSGC